jgi:hypothetical protein
LRRPEDYSPEQGARFEVHFEKLRNRVGGDHALPFEAKIAATSTDETGVRWLDHDLRPPVLKRAAQLFNDGLSVREVAATLGISKTEAGRLRLRALDEGLLVAGRGGERLKTNGGFMSLRLGKRRLEPNLNLAYFRLGRCVPVLHVRGGLPIFRSGQIEGGCGISGTPSHHEQEEACARAAIANLGS